MNCMNEENKVKMSKLIIEIDKLQKEAVRLAGQSYSQSDPSAMMERQDNRRWLARAEREYYELITKYKNASDK